MNQETDKPSPVSDGPVPSSADAAHTPGPWEVVPAVLGGPYPSIVSHTGDAELGNWLVAERVRWDVDARLIAAAPDMLAALDQLTAFVSIMIGQGPDATIPETVRTPLGVPVKVGKIMRAANEARALALGSKP